MLNCCHPSRPAGAGRPPPPGRGDRRDWRSSSLTQCA